MEGEEAAGWLNSPQVAWRAVPLDYAETEIGARESKTCSDALNTGFIREAGSLAHR